MNVTEARSVVRIEAVVEDFLTDKGKGQRGESGTTARTQVASSTDSSTFSSITKTL